MKKLSITQQKNVSGGNYYCQFKNTNYVVVGLNSGRKILYKNWDTASKCQPGLATFGPKKPNQSIINFFIDSIKNPCKKEQMLKILEPNIQPIHFPDLEN